MLLIVFIFYEYLIKPNHLLFSKLNEKRLKDLKIRDGEITRDDLTDQIVYYEQRKKYLLPYYLQSTDNVAKD